jgi:hypothetical protein
VQIARGRISVGGRRARLLLASSSLSALLAGAGASPGRAAACTQAERNELRGLVQTYEAEYRKSVVAKVAQLKGGA